MRLLSGGGGFLGGPQGARQPTVASDTLRSKDRIEAIMGLCQGPIKGLTNGHKSFFLGSTAFQNIDGSYNVPLFILDINPGFNPATPIIPVLGGYEDWRGVHQPLVAGVTQTITTVASEISQIILRLNFTKLYRTGTDAQLAALPGVANVQSTFLPHTAAFTVKWKVVGADDSTLVDPFDGPLTITGKTQDNEVHEIRFRTTGTGPFEVRFTLITPNDTAGGKFCQASFQGIYEVTPGVFGTTKSTTVNQNLAPAVSVVRTSDYPPVRVDGTTGIDFLNIRFYVAQLFETNASTGDVSLEFVDVLIEYKSTASPTWIILHGGAVRIYGKTTSGYVASYRWPVPAQADTYDIRVTRATADEPNHTRSLAWESFQEIIGGSPTFNGVATAHIVGQSSDQFTTVPDLWGIYDLKLCKIPTNYDPYTRVYDGVWDGTFQEEWTSNPAWCLYDLVTNPEYGAVAYWPGLVLNKWTVYAAGKYCDELVPNGSGGTQPRYTCNGLINTPRGIREQIRYMAGIFNGVMVDDLNGNMSLVWDREVDAAALFTPENIIGDFSYSYTDPSTRYNDITVKFVNPSLDYQPDTRKIQANAEHLSRFGRIPLAFDAIMCTNPHEAVRRAAYKMLTTINETEIVSFTVNRQGLLIKPFDKILIGDPDMGYALTGRIKTLSLDRTVVGLRDPLYLEAGVNYVFQTHKANPDYPASSDNPLLVVSVPFNATYTGQTRLLTLNEPIPLGVFERAQFSIGSEGNLAGIPQGYKVTKVEEADGDPDNISIEAIYIYGPKYELSDAAIDRNGLDFLNYPETIAPPTELSVQTQVVEINYADRANVVLTWKASRDPRVTRTYVEYRVTGDLEWIAISEVRGTRADIYDLPNGLFDFRISSGASRTARSIWVASVGVNAGLHVPPDDVAEITATVQGDTLHLSWIAAFAKNVTHYWVRFTPALDSSASWNSATDLVLQVPGTSVSAPAVAGTYFVKAVNSYGVASLNAGSVVPTSGTVSNFSIADEQVQNPTWPGTKVGLTVDGLLLKNLTGNVNEFGSYLFLTADLEEIYTCRVSLEMVVSAEVDGQNMDSWESLTNVTSLSGVRPTDYYSQVYIAISNDGGTTYGPWQTFQTGYYTGRRFAISIYLGSNAPYIYPSLSSLKSIIQLPNRTESKAKCVSISTGYEVTFDKPFFAEPTVLINLRAAPTAGTYYQMYPYADPREGFTLFVYDADDNDVVGALFDWMAVGYGARE
jgi:predicted phage tail protein